jgi:hypothetical protein
LASSASLASCSNRSRLWMDCSMASTSKRPGNRIVSVTDTLY